jgi:hypothetical protein
MWARSAVILRGFRNWIIPQAFICCAAGNLYFEDLQNDRIRKISLTVTTVAGNGTPDVIGTSAIIYPMSFLKGVKIKALLPID